MSLTDTGVHRNRQWTHQLLANEAARCEADAAYLRDQARRLTDKARVLEAEAAHFRAQLTAEREVA